MWQDTILTEYSASDKLLAIIDTFNQALSLDDFTDDFIEQVWDIDTCGAFGLDMWGKIVGIDRQLTIDINDNYFGFFEADTGGDGYPTTFDDGQFFNCKQSTSNVTMNDMQYRTAILAKAFTNISVSTIPEINRLLKILFFGRGSVHCVNNRNMTINIVFEFPIAPYEVAILEKSHVLPMPSGVLPIIIEA